MDRYVITLSEIILSLQPGFQCFISWFVLKRHYYSEQNFELSFFSQVLSDSSRTHAPYLFHQDAEYDIANRSFQCGRRADGFKLWLCDQLDDLNAQATLMYDRNIEMKQIIAQDDRFIQVLGDSMTHTCFQLNTDKPVDIHRIVAHMRKENMFLEYHSDYFRLVLVNKEIVAEDFLKILERVIEVQAEFCS